MDKNEYLVARVAGLKFGIYCRDVRNVYCDNLKLARLFYQGQIFRGVTRINGEIMQVLDLRRRIGAEANNDEEILTVISFQTEMDKTIAVIVDEIIGMKAIYQNQVSAQNKNLNNQDRNIDLLFPMIAVTDDGDLIHLLDATYLDKTDPIQEEAGDLEFF